MVSFCKTDFLPLPLLLLDWPLGLLLLDLRLVKVLLRAKSEFMIEVKEIMSRMNMTMEYLKVSNKRKTTRK